MSDALTARFARRGSSETNTLRRSEIPVSRTGDLIPTGSVQPPALTDSARRALEGFLAVADGISQALAGDSLERFNQQIPKLRTAVPALEKEFPAPHRWNGLVRQFALLSRGSPAKDLAEARKQFLPFSVSTVELVKQLRQQDKAFGTLKVYFCPMAPKPGLWFQAKGPLSNPYYGSEMLRCGEEVKL
jgi:Cu(I)/Ag(I) efflux system membrane fusion protein